MLKKNLATTKKDQFWIGHVKKAQAFKGSNLEYCKLNNYFEFFVIVFMFSFL